jgi:ribosomal protein S18 acetylase RimI-like enzyme
MMVSENDLFLHGDPESLACFLKDIKAGEKLDFFAVNYDLFPLIDEFFILNPPDEVCDTYTIGENELRGIEKHPSNELNIKDCFFVNDNWDFKSEGSISFIQDCITNRPTVAVRIDGKLVGWALCYSETNDMVEMGSLKVLPDYRNNDIGYSLAVGLTKKVLEKKKTPILHILETNKPSVKLTTAIGFKRTGNKVFWGKGTKK